MTDETGPELAELRRLQRARSLEIIRDRPDRQRLEELRHLIRRAEKLALEAERLA